MHRGSKWGRVKYVLEQEIYHLILKKKFRPCDGKPLEGRMKRKVCECYLSLELFVKLYLDFDVVPLKIKLQSENL